MSTTQAEIVDDAVALNAVRTGMGLGTTRFSVAENTCDPPTLVSCLRSIPSTGTILGCKAY